MNIKIKITESVLKNLPNEVTRINDTEITGFFVRAGKLKACGRKISFIMRYRVGGRSGIQREYKICNYGDIPVNRVRELAFQLSARIAANEDISATKQNLQRLAIEKYNEQKFSVLLDEFIQYCKTHRKDPEPVRAIEKDIRPLVGKEPLEQITKRMLVTRVLDPILHRGSRVQANKTLSLLKQILDFGVERGLLNENCLQGTRRKSIGGTEAPRERFLSLSEMRTVFRTLPELGLCSQIVFCIKLLVLTGCRVNEICLAKWSDIDFENELWVIPPENVKAKVGREKNHIIPLNDALICTLKEMQSELQEYRSEYILPSPCTSEDKYIDKRSVARAVNRKQSSFNIEKWTPHDLRRTVQTHLASMGIDAIVIEKILNHELTGMLRVYNRYDYLKERKEALQLWSETLINEIF